MVEDNNSELTQLAEKKNDMISMLESNRQVKRRASSIS
jgi:hypothetical protein